METRYSVDNVRYQGMTTDELRSSFLVDNLFRQTEITLLYSEVDRVIIGSAAPVERKLTLSSAKELAAEYFTQRRENGVINIGGRGKIVVDGKEFGMENRDGLYIGRGSRVIEFETADNKSPALFYFLSYPAHCDYPTVQAKKADAEAVHLGSKKEANERTIYKYIHPGGIQSCQLVMGFTELAEGSVWNTMPTHTHERRMEVYLYFDVPDGAAVFHLMGKPSETRHVVIRNRQAVISPSWSIHAGVGTSNYTFIWGMGGENQDFGDMQGVDMENMK
ncbi:5-dehydro-4-deoxy-D-glucuronate isomerase [Chloroflexota bacterium]